MRCRRCQDTGMYLDFGMMQADCDCKDEKPVTPQRESKAYKEAISKIMKSSKVGRDEATKIFETEFSKIA